MYTSALLEISWRKVSLDIESGVKHKLHRNESSHKLMIPANRFVRTVPLNKLVQKTARDVNSYCCLLQFFPVNFFGDMSHKNCHLKPKYNLHLSMLILIYCYVFLHVNESVLWTGSINSLKRFGCRFNGCITLVSLASEKKSCSLYLEHF